MKIAALQSGVDRLEPRPERQNTDSLDRQLSMAVYQALGEYFKEGHVLSVSLFINDPISRRYRVSGTESIVK
jgi:hypothetical protein